MGQKRLRLYITKIKCAREKLLNAERNRTSDGASFKDSIFYVAAGSRYAFLYYSSNIRLQIFRRDI